MILLDTNILLYAYNTDAPQHGPSARWLSDTFNGDELIGLPLTTMWAFLRIATNARLWTHPLTASAAFAIVHDWLNHPSVSLLHPGPRHLELLEKLTLDHAVSGPLMSDAVLAALAVENGAVLASTDQGFSRFRGLKWVNPLRQEGKS